MIDNANLRNTIRSLYIKFEFIMKKLIAVTVLCLALNAYGQRRISSDLILDPNHCDSSILSRQEFENCKRDSSFNHITLRSNYITFIKTKLLPKYRIERKALILPEAIKKDVKLLKAIYDSTLNFKLQKISADMDRNQMYV